MLFVGGTQPMILTRPTGCQASLEWKGISIIVQLYYFNFSDFEHCRWVLHITASRGIPVSSKMQMGERLLWWWNKRKSSFGSFNIFLLVIKISYCSFYRKIFEWTKFGNGHTKTSIKKLFHSIVCETMLLCAFFKIPLQGVPIANSEKLAAISENSS